MQPPPPPPLETRSVEGGNSHPGSPAKRLAPSDGAEASPSGADKKGGSGSQTPPGGMSADGSSVDPAGVEGKSGAGVQQEGVSTAGQDDHSSRASSEEVQCCTTYVGTDRKCCKSVMDGGCL